MVHKDVTLLVRVQPEIKAELERLAKADSRSLSNYVALLLRAHVVKGEEK